ncbi:hypothetical protein BDY21DRAFT_369466 [Lineolata rhizophorae]|uniref:Uncharacterized protein n=1 Tax=Lineolata rhizophorae TaxID=578093 RepID=A0A6A6P9A9_9PEZI|nr:hypothetical protein BDY21DRAFT_369466 [Lineolata rhizophorae]
MRVSVPTSSSSDDNDDEDSSPSTTAAAASDASATPTNTAAPLPFSDSMVECSDPSTGPFCLPHNASDVYVGDTYYVTWDASMFPTNSTVRIALNFANDTERQAFQTAKLPKEYGYTAIEMKESYLQSFDRFNLTFLLRNYAADADADSSWFDGPLVQLQHRPPRHYEPQTVNKNPDKLSLIIALPLVLGSLFIVVCGLYFGMRKQRKIGLGNIMGKRNKGYGIGKSRRQRLGLGKKGAIRLEERDGSAGFRSSDRFRDEDSLEISRA